METFGERLRRLRLQKFGRSLSLRETASRLAITHTYLVQLEAGREKPSKDLARRIARLFREDERGMVFSARGVPDAIKESLADTPLTVKCPQCGLKIQVTPQQFQEGILSSNASIMGKRQTPHAGPGRPRKDKTK